MYKKYNKIFSLFLIFLACCFLFTGCGVDYFHSEEYLSLSPKNKVIEILERKGVYYEEEKLLSIDIEENYNSTIYTTNLYYFVEQDEMGLGFYQEMTDGTFKVQLILEENKKYLDLWSRLDNQNEENKVLAYSEINPLVFKKDSMLTSIDYYGPSSYKTQYTSLMTVSLKLAITQLNKELGNYNFSLKEFGFINFS